MSIPPSASNLEAEKAALAAILCGASFDFAQLVPEDFHSPLHRRLYARLQSMAAAQEPLNILTVTEPMGLDGIETAAVGALLDPLYRPFTAENIGSYVRILKCLARERDLQQFCDNFLNANGNIPLRALELQSAAQRYLETAAPESADGSVLHSCSTAELFTAQEKEIDWLCWPFAAVGLASILDALPKAGKTIFLLHGILASRQQRQFLNFPTKPMHVVYVSEQSRASLAMQARQVGFTGEEPIEELRWITREDWSRFIYTDFLAKLEKQILEPGEYNALIEDTFHTIARMEDEKDPSEANRLGNLTIDIATRNNLALALARHDRKSGGNIGVSGRSSNQLSGLVDVILHLVHMSDRPAQRKLELLGRVPGLPTAQTIELCEREYLNWGEPSESKAEKEAATLDAMLQAEPKLAYRTIADRMSISKNRVNQIAKAAGWAKDEESGVWSKAS